MKELKGFEKFNHLFRVTLFSRDRAGTEPQFAWLVHIVLLPTLIDAYIPARRPFLPANYAATYKRIVTVNSGKEITKFASKHSTYFC